MLNDDDCLQEFKSHNEKLLNYFEHDKIAKLIEMITEMPSQDVDHARGHKFPFLSSEIFSCENNVILDKFFEAPAKAKASQPEEDAADDNDRLQGNNDDANNGDSNNDDIGNLDEDIVQHDEDAENDNAKEGAEEQNKDSAATENKEENAAEEKKDEAADEMKHKEKVMAAFKEFANSNDDATTVANEPESESSASEEKPTAAVSEPEEEDTATSSENKDAAVKQEPEPESQGATEDN